MPPLGSRRSFASGVFVTLITLLFPACGGDPPDREMQQAQAAIDTARAAGAGQYAPQELAAAEDALKNAVAAVDQRDYRLALNHALDSRERALNATRQTADGKAAEREAAGRAVAAATSALGTARGLMKAAEAGRASAKTLATARSTVAAADARVQEAGAANARGDFSAATTAAVAVTEQLQPVIADLKAASAPAPRRRR
jgi:hypothetical protein